MGIAYHPLTRWYDYRFPYALGENKSAKSVYLLSTSIGTSSAFKWAIWALLKECTSSPESTPRAAICTTMTSYSESKAAIANSFFPINSTYLVVRSISPVV